VRAPYPASSGLVLLLAIATVYMVFIAIRCVAPDLESDDPQCKDSSLPVMSQVVPDRPALPVCPSSF